MSKPNQSKPLKKLMAYVLGRRPDEFGLVLDDQGFVSVKDLVRAINEEPGWAYVRQSHVREVLMTARERAFVMEGNRIRVLQPHGENRLKTESTPPRILYHCIRPRAHPVVCRDGIKGSGEKPVLLTTDQALAVRIGKRKGQTPVLLTVQARKASEAGIKFFKHGEFIYTADHIPPDCFSAPLLPAEKKRETPKPKTEPTPPPETLAGSLVFDAERSKALFKDARRRKGSKKRVGWKEDVRKSKRRQGGGRTKSGET